MFEKVVTHHILGWCTLLTSLCTFHLWTKYYYFINGTYFAAKTHCGALDYDSWTGQPKMVKRDYRHLCLTPLNFIDWKVMLYPESERQTSWIAIDPDCPVLCKEIQIPYFPKPGEVVKTRNGRDFLNLLVTLVQRVQEHQLKLHKWVHIVVST